MGFSIADQLNQLPRGMDGQVLTGNEPQTMQPAVMPPGTQGGPADLQYPQLGQGSPGLGGKGGMPMPTPPAGTQGGPADLQYPQPGQAPGMGGKGGGGPIAQIPIDMSGQVLGAGQTAQPGQAPGLPTPQAPMVPQGGKQPGQGPMNLLKQYGQALGFPQGQGPRPAMGQPVRPQTPAAYGRNAVVNPRARVTAQPIQSMKRGAGRGGLMR
jgi:hypothetical protein